jgi:hypothetical protein
MASLAQMQTLAVSINQFTDSNRLTNSSFTVFSRSNPLDILQIDPNVSWRFSINETNGLDKVGQVMSFYWANHAAKTALDNTGLFFASNKSIKIVINDSISGWAPRANQIHLSMARELQSQALDASVLLYHLAMANLDYATEGRVHVFSEPKHRICGSVGNFDCCLSSAGCSRAIASGQADYFVAMNFPDSPAFADGWTNNNSGKSICNSEAHRNLNQLMEMTFSEAYELCAESEQQGSIYAMGAVYSSLWWSIRNQVEDRSKIDQLYMMHLREITGDDDFASVRDKIIALDTEQFDGQFSELVLGEFRKRMQR